MDEFHGKAKGKWPEILLEKIWFRWNYRQYFCQVPTLLLLLLLSSSSSSSSLLYAFFWVILRRLNLICRRFGTLCIFHLHRRVGMKILHTYPPMKMEQCVPKRRHIKFRRRKITQKKVYNIQNAAKVWNQEWFPLLSPLCKVFTIMYA